MGKCPSAFSRLRYCYRGTLGITHGFEPHPGGHFKGAMDRLNSALKFTGETLNQNLHSSTLRADI